MKKSIFILSVLALLASGCNPADKKPAAEGINAAVEANADVVGGQSADAELLQTPKKVKYFFQANGGSVVFFDDGTAVKCSRCELDSKDLAFYKPNATYEEYPGYLLTDKKDKWEFFDDLGRIAIDWLIINYHEVETIYSIIGYQPYSNAVPADSVQTVKETCLIEIWGEPQHFEDENSVEADAYFTEMDDFNYYMAETREHFKKMGIKSINAQKRYLCFTIAGNEKIIVDTRKEHNGRNFSLLLYKKGHIPLFLNLIFGDNDVEFIENYLK